MQVERSSSIIPPSAPPSPVTAPTSTTSTPPSVTQPSTPSAPSAPPSSAPSPQVGNPRDLQAIQSRIQSAVSGELTAQIQKLESTTFSNSVSKFFHGVFGTDTYKNFQSAENVLKATHAARSEAMTAANQAMSSGNPTELAHAKRLMAKSELISASRSGQLSAPQLKAYKELDSSAEGREVLKQMNLLNSTEVTNLRVNATADEISARDLSPINRSLVLQKSPQEQEALASLHTEIHHSSGFAESNQLLLSRDSLRSYAFEAWMSKREFSGENPMFLMKAKDLIETQPAPTLQDIRNLFADMIEGGNSGGGIGQEEVAKINLPGSIYDPLKAAIDRNDYAAALTQLSAAVKNISALIGNDSFPRFVKCEQEEPKKMAEFIQKHVPQPIQEYFSLKESLANSGLI